MGLSDPETLWLTVMNAALGLAVLAFGLMIGVSAAREWARRRRRVRLRRG